MFNCVTGSCFVFLCIFYTFSNEHVYQKPESPTTNEKTFQMDASSILTWKIGGHGYYSYLSQTGGNGWLV